MAESFPVRLSPLRVLLVCTGNTCRSPMAEALLRDLLARNPTARPIEVLSAGTGAFPGDLAAPTAVAVFKERGIDLSAHRSRAVSTPLLDGVDLVLAMTARHKDVVLQMAPELSGRVFTLGEAVAGALRGQTPATAEDVPDPIGASEHVYRQTADRLEQLLRALVDELQRFPARADGGAPEREHRGS